MREKLIEKIDELYDFCCYVFSFREALQDDHRTNRYITWANYGDECMGLCYLLKKTSNGFFLIWIPMKKIKRMKKNKRYEMIC